MFCASVSTELARYKLEYYYYHYYYYISREAIVGAKCILVTRVCVCVCLSLAAFTHYCTDQDVTWGMVVRYWADLQSAPGFRCNDSTAPNAKCQRVIVHHLCLVRISGPSLCL